MNFKEVCVAVVLRAFTAFIKFAMEVENFHLIKQPGLHPSGFHRLKSFLYVGCWNVCSLVKADGGVKTATVQTGKQAVAVNQKLKMN